jgi:hypothetical protein
MFSIGLLVFDLLEFLVDIIFDQLVADHYGKINALFGGADKSYWAATPAIVF